MRQAITKRLKVYQLTALFSVVFALVGFSYNVWRLELSEQNNSKRVASFEILQQLSALEHLVYAAHYDKNPIDGNPRKGWIKVGLIADLSVLTNPTVVAQAGKLKSTWSNNWRDMSDDGDAVDRIVVAIDSARLAVKEQILELE